MPGLVTVSEKDLCMTEYLIVARAAIIIWTSLALMPTEILFDAIEAELECRGVELNGLPD